MENKIKAIISEWQLLWSDLSMESVEKIKSSMEALAKDKEIQTGLLIQTRSLPDGYELFRAQREGFILLAYHENEGIYRIAHNHGDAWVVYAVLSGEVEMGNYFNAVRKDRGDHLILKNREKLKMGDTRIYLPGEIHDTRCVSESAVILRLTSLDLRLEEQAGRMRRYQ